MVDNWRSEASCLGIEHRLFFEGFEDASMNERIEIIGICANCPVLDECYDDAYATKADGCMRAGFFWRDGVAKDGLKIRRSRILSAA